MATHSRNYPLLATRVLGAPLLVRGDKLEAILRAVGPRLGIAPRADAEDLLDEVSEAAEEREVRRGSIAVLPIVGSLISRGSWMDAFSGMVSYGEISQSIAELVADDEVDGILLEIDSFGGEAAGLFDLVEEIRAAKAEKPIWASVNHSAYSAAYAVASACDKVYVTSTGGVGSIGVVAAHADWSGYDRDLGVEVTFIHAGQKKVDGNPHEPLSDRARADLQSEVDRLYGLFLESVAADGRMTTEQARATEAGTYHGERAVEAGLADEVGTLNQAAADMADALAVTVTTHSSFGHSGFGAHFGSSTHAA